MMTPSARSSRSIVLPSLTISLSTYMRPHFEITRWIVSKLNDVQTMLISRFVMASPLSGSL